MDLQIALIHALQLNNANWAPFFQYVSDFNEPEFFLLAIPLVLWCWNRTLGIRILVLIAISGVVRDVIKLLTHFPRPYWVSTDVQAFDSSTSFSFPSGHSQNAVIFFGLIAAEVKKRWVTVVCVFLVLVIGLARIFLAVHWPSDVLGGFVIGLILLFTYLHYEQRIVAWASRRPFGIQLALVFLASILLILGSLLAMYLVSSWQMPDDWAALALVQGGAGIDPFVAHKTPIAAGLFLGGLVGVVAGTRLDLAGTDGSIGKKAARYILGIAVLFAIWLLLGTVVDSIPDPGSYVVQYARATLAGLWITAGAPFLFRKAGL